MENYYAIQVIGYGKRQGYSIRRCNVRRRIGDPVHNDPVDRKCYRTLEAAQLAAAALGIEISRIGDAYQLIMKP